MDVKGQFVFFLLALICFVIAALWDNVIGPPENRSWRTVNLTALGLALVDFVWMYSAWKAF